MLPNNFPDLAMYALALFVVGSFALAAVRGR